MFKELYGNKFSKKDYDAAIAAGQNPEKIEKRLLEFNAAGANIGDRVFTNRMGYGTVDPSDGLMGPFQQTSKGTMITPPAGRQYAPPTSGVNPLAEMTGADMGPMAPGSNDLGPAGRQLPYNFNTYSFNTGNNMFPKAVPMMGPVKYF